jgi:hypothetical protein
MATAEAHFDGGNHFNEGTVIEAWADDASEEADSALTPASNAFLQGTDWTVETLLSQLRQGNIDVSPAFQRRSVWNTVRMSRFIESIFVGFPIPQLVLASDKARRGAFIVLDGKQRLSALSKFALMTDADPEPLRLTGLDLLPDFNGRTFQELSDDPVVADDLRMFLNTTIRTVVISNWVDDSYLNLVFHRLNTGSVALSSQELRQALYPGAFSTRINEFAARSSALHRALRTTEADFRMRDTELALRFVAFQLRMPDYAGNLKTFLDQTTSLFNDGWVSAQGSVEDALNSLESGIGVAMEIFGEDAFRRFADGRYESLFNRAIFDVQAFYFSKVEYAELALARGPQVKSAFEELLVADTQFATAVSSTTKSLGATYYRLEAWGKALFSVLGIPGKLPVRRDDGRIEWGVA